MKNAIEVYNINNCVWKKKKYCKVNKCLKDCDFATLKFKSDDIKKRVLDERIIIKELVFKFRDRKKDVIMDKVMGIHRMMDILEKEFGVENKFKNINELRDWIVKTKLSDVKMFY